MQLLFSRSREGRQLHSSSVDPTSGLFTRNNFVCQSCSDQGREIPINEDVVPQTPSTPEADENEALQTTLISLASELQQIEEGENVFPFNGPRARHRSEEEEYQEQQAWYQDWHRRFWRDDSWCQKTDWSNSWYWTSEHYESWRRTSWNNWVDEACSDRAEGSSVSTFQFRESLVETSTSSISDIVAQSAAPLSNVSEASPQEATMDGFYVVPG